MATAVQIELMVDEKGAVTGFRSFNAEVKSGVVDVNSLDATLQKLNAHLDKLGQSAPRATKLYEQGMLSAREQTRLLSEEMGIHVPRAMQSVISKCPELAGAISKISGAMIGLGAIQIGGMIFEQAFKGAEKLWDKLTSLPKAVQDYMAEVEKSKNQDFGNTHSIETTRLRIDEASEALRRFREEENRLQNNPQQGWRQIIPVVGGIWQEMHNRSQIAEEQTKAIEEQKKLDALQHPESEQWHKRMEGDIAARHAGDSKLKDPQARHDAEIQEAREKAFETRRFNNELDRLKGNSVDQNAGADEERQTIAAATLKANEELANAREAHHKPEKANLSEENKLVRERLAAGREQNRQSLCRYGPHCAHPGGDGDQETDLIWSQ